MKVIIAGSRTLEVTNKELTGLFFLTGWQPTEIVCGGADGIDSCGERWAQDNGIPISYFRADWDKYGNAAGPIRNREMADYADALLAIWNYSSRGTGNIVEAMERRRKPIRVWIIL